MLFSIILVFAGCTSNPETNLKKYEYIDIFPRIHYIEGGSLPYIYCKENIFDGVYLPTKNNGFFAIALDSPKLYNWVYEWECSNGHNILISYN
jgi:hypothetical protein